MLNSRLIEKQENSKRVQPLETKVVENDIQKQQSANACRKEVEKLMYQRLRRRHNRALMATGGSTGWVSRLW